MKLVSSSSQTSVDGVPPPTQTTSNRVSFKTIDQFSTQKTQVKQPTKIKTWENMFSDFLGFFQRKQMLTQDNYVSYQVILKKLQKDPIEITTPLDQLNVFQLDPKLRYKFRQYLLGQREATDMLEECNRTKTIMERQLRNKHKELKYRAQNKEIKMQGVSQDQNNEFKFLNLLGMDEDGLRQKIRVQKRYDLIRKLIQRNMEIRDKQKTEMHFKDVQIFKRIHDAVSDAKAQIQHRSCFQSVDSSTQEIEYEKHYRTAGIRMRKYPSQESVREHKNVFYIKDKTKSLESRQSIKIRRTGDMIWEDMEKKKKASQAEYIKQLKHNNLAQKLFYHSQSKSQQQTQRNPNKRRQSQLTIVSQKEIKIADDGKVKAYIQGKLRDEDQVEPQIQTERVSRQSRYNSRPKLNQDKHRVLANFNQDVLSNANSQSDDNSLASIMEGKLTDIYQTSRQIQKNILGQKTATKFSKQIIQMDRLYDLGHQALYRNRQKLACHSQL